MMKNKYNKYKKIGMVFICIFAISLFFIFNNSNKNKISRLVNNNINLLNECVENKDYDKAGRIRGIKEISQYYLTEDELFIDFFCYGYGIVPSSTYYGFYYISSDRSVGFQGLNVNLERERKGWKWKEVNGDNWYYTEKISDHWYYYEAGF